MPLSGSEFEIVSLSAHHRRDLFTCGASLLDEWLRKYARQNEEHGLTRTYVAVPKGDLRVVGYFTLRTSEIQYAAVPPEEVRRFPKYPIPTILVARLAVDRSFQGKGLGEDLLMMALAKAVQASSIAGAALVDVVAIDEKAKGFYPKYGFRELLENRMHLFLRMSKARQVFVP